MPSMPLLRCLAVSALPMLLLAAWSALYPLTEIAVLAPLVAALLVALVAYRLTLARRRALAEAALRPGSALYPLLAGRMGAALAALLLAAVPLLAIAYFALEPGAAGWSAMSALVLLTSILSMLGQRALSAEVRPAFRPGLLLPVVATAAATPVAAAHACFDYALAPLPDWIDAASAAAMLAAALDDLPRRGSPVIELIAALRAMEVAAYWLLKIDGARSLPLLVFIAARDLLVFFGLATWLACLQALALSSSFQPGSDSHGRQ